MRAHRKKNWLYQFKFISSQIYFKSALFQVSVILSQWVTVDTGIYSYLMDDIRSLSWTILTPKPRNLFISLGVKKGDRVSTMLPRTPTAITVKNLIT
ncbi:hypothetical protein B8W92_04870 [Moraxella osloensis]|nr:hypothetical protein KSH_06740 [Moraxella osloensis]PAL16514.1 hypothetical protein B8W92_04870 [Moraxella osloensis]